ncbi:MAG TPA: hypothetical protein VIS77_05000 [Burkholderiales bacterium]
MHDGPALAALLVFFAWVAVRVLFRLLERRALRASGTRLAGRPLVHWHYAREEWRAHCERLRGELWSRQLRPLAQWLLPLLVLPVILSPVIEAPAGLSAAELLLLVALGALVVGNLLLGPVLRQFVQLSRRRALDYEVVIGERGVLEIWRHEGHVEAMEEHLFPGHAIEQVEANGVEPAEIVFRTLRPLEFGFLHLEDHFLVPAGHLAEARELARRLTPRHTPPRPGAEAD